MATQNKIAKSKNLNGNNKNAISSKKKVVYTKGDKRLIQEYLTVTGRPASKPEVQSYMEGFGASHETTGRRLREMVADKAIARRGTVNNLTYVAR
jgi:hypothetical protein